jgi:hypothetical protein
LILYCVLKEGGAFLYAIEQRMLPGRATQLDLLGSDGSTVMRSYWLGRTIVSAVTVAITENDDFGAGVAMLLVVLVVNLLPHDGGSDHLDRRQGGQVLPGGIRVGRR